MHKMLNQKKADPNEHILHDFISIKFSNRQNSILEVLAEVPMEEGGLVAEESWRAFLEC